MHPKYLIYRDEEYLSFIRNEPSIISRKLGCDPHHWKNSGGKNPNDYLAVPLTREEHSEVHFIGNDSFEKKYNISFEVEIIKLLCKYFAGADESKEAY